MDEVDDYMCDRCQETLLFGDPECHRCHKQYNIKYWDSFLFDGLNNKVRKNQGWDSMEVYDLTLCCNVPESECSCEKKITWQDTYAVPQKVGEETYAYNSECSSCLFYYTPQCIPYRSSLLNFLSTGAIEPPIEDCSFYQIDPLCKPQPKLQYVPELDGYIDVSSRGH